MGMCMSPTIRISYFLTVGRGNSKPPIVIVEIFPLDLYCGLEVVSSESVPYAHDH